MFNTFNTFLRLFALLDKITESPVECCDRNRCSSPEPPPVQQQLVPVRDKAEVNFELRDLEVRLSHLVGLNRPPQVFHPLVSL